ncbi:Pyridinium-3 [Phytophthora citrophthora]|uniref:Pyridinium-3 n=1 Tax=Phytophthora citrophthora TaxID=4793 RepID=A0AAD9LU56_9STRA|nr:Pyridinium-3 [Phytophthora citrophthora]
MSGPTIAFIDCSAGIAGDMLLGALIDAGAPLEEVKRGLESLKGIKGEWELSTTKAWKGPGSIAGTKAHVSSIYQHKEAGPPTPIDHSHSHSHEHGHSHSHGHGHSHTHGHGHDDTHTHEEVVSEVESSTVEMSHDHSHDHHHEHEHEHEHEEEGEPMRNLDDIKALINESDLSSWVKEKSIAVFTLLAQAEAHTHGTTLEEIHFHEVGAIDSIVDTIGSVIALDLLGVREVHASFLPFSSGTVKCMHGVLPVPPPATFRLMIGVPVCPAPKGAKGELVTPTGISLVKALASTFGEPPAFIPTHTGVGAGTKEFPEHANIVRVAIGTKIDPMATEKSYVNAAATLRSPCPFTTEKVVVLETNVDDLNPQVIGYVSERLLTEHHALDVWKQPIQMKKNRPGVCLSVLCRAEHEEEILEALFRETTTLGVRRNVMDRVFLSRKFVSVTAFGRSVDVKVAFYGDEAVNVHPEFEDCKAIAVEQNIPLLQVIDAVKIQALSHIKSQ